MRKFKYDETYDIAYYKFTNEKIYETIDYSENIAVDIDDNGNMVGIEVQNHSESFDELNQFYYNREYGNFPIFEIEKKDKVNMVSDYDYELAA